MKGQRVAVADDSSFIRKALRRILSREPGVELVGLASSGEELLAHLDEWQPDTVILDLSMPGMGGLETLDALVARHPDPLLSVIILSTHSRKDAPQTIEALHRGATDFIDKQQYSLVDFDALRGVLLEKIRQVGARREPPAAAELVDASDPLDLSRSGALSLASPEKSGAASKRGKSGRHHEKLAAESSGGVAHERVVAATLPPPARVDLIVLGASTGGPPAIERILRDLGADLAVPIALVQHMPAAFTRSFAERLNSHLPLAVKEAAHREPLLPGTVYIARGGIHLRVEHEEGQLRAALSSSPEEAPHCPSVDVLFSSAGAAVGRRLIAVLLTGMGHDGASTMAELTRDGIYTLVQDQASSVVYGMPRAAIAAGGAREILPLSAIGSRLRELLDSLESAALPVASE